MFNGSLLKVRQPRLRESAVLTKVLLLPESSMMPTDFEPVSPIAFTCAVCIKILPWLTVLAAVTVARVSGASEIDCTRRRGSGVGRRGRHGGIDSSPGRAAADERVVSSTAAGAAWLGSCAVRRTMAGLEAPVAGTSASQTVASLPPPSSSLFSSILQPGAGTRRMRSAATAPAERLAAL